MAVSGLSFGAVKFAGFEKPEEKQRRSHERKRDADKRRRDGSERQEIEQKARAKCGERGSRRFTAREVIRTFHQVVELGRGVERFVLFHVNQRIAAHRPAARIGA